MMDHHGVTKLWDPEDTQFCDGCGLNHFKDECTDTYFNDPDNWRQPRRTPAIKENAASTRYRKHWEN